MLLVLVPFQNQPPVNHLAITDLQHSKPREDGIWSRTALSQVPNSINTWVGKIVNEWIMDYFYPASCSMTYLFISFTFRGIIANRNWDLHRLFLSVMCPPYENWSNYWLSCPQQVKSVNGSIPILMSKKDQLSLWCVRKAKLLWHEDLFPHSTPEKTGSYFWQWKALSYLWA